MLQVQSLSARYRSGGTVLDGVELQVGDGEFVTVLGSNGAGKTTLLRAITGTLRLRGGVVTGGDIRWEGRSLLRVSPRKRLISGIAMSPEGRGIFANLTVKENLKAGGFTLRSGVRRQRVDEALGLFPDLTDRAQQHAGLLSGGQQQMLALARALIVRPRLLLLDEPSLGLAPLMVARVAEVVTRIHREGTSVLLIEQNAGMALEISERGYVLDRGKAILSGKSSDLLATDEVRNAYLGGGSDRVPAAETKPLAGKKGRTA